MFSMIDMFVFLSIHNTLSTLLQHHNSKAIHCYTHNHVWHNTQRRFTLSATYFVSTNSNIPMGQRLLWHYGQSTYLNFYLQETTSFQIQNIIQCCNDWLSLNIRLWYITSNVCTVYFGEISSMVHV